MTNDLLLSNLAMVAAIGAACLATFLAGCLVGVLIWSKYGRWNIFTPPLECQEIALHRRASAPRSQS
jgi:hypothetical protein